MARPGIMLYFDMLPPIRVLPDADKGRLLVAMLEYGKDGVMPQFEGMLALAWGFVQPKLDRDQEEYERTVLRRQFATFCRERKRKGEPEISFEEWLKITGNHHVISHDTNDDQWYPTTKGTITTKSKGTTKSKAAVAVTGNDEAATAAQRELRKMGGELGKGVVLLSSVQIDDLLDRMGLDAFDHYVDKLASFIIRNDAKVADHHGTILKWWRQDCGAE